MNQQHIDAGISIDIAGLVAIGAQSGLVDTRLLRNARSVLAGAHLSTFRGRGMDFAESREYQQGDDRRHIDWRVTARTGKAHTKLYTEEKERPVFLLVDMSASMYFGTQGGFKSVTAARLAAFLAWNTIAAGDRVGGIIGRQNRKLFVDLRPASGRRGALKMINALSAATNLDGGDRSNKSSLLNDLLEQAGRLIHPGSQVFIISDFYEIDDTTHKMVSRLGRHNDLMLCHIVDELEASPPVPGRYRFTDGDSSCAISLVNRNGRERYQNLFLERADALASLARSFSIPKIRMSATDTLSMLFSENGAVSEARKP